MCQAVQFDRLGDVRLGRTDVFAFSTAEPRGDGVGRVRWTTSKDITDYTALDYTSEQLVHPVLRRRRRRRALLC